MQEPIINHQHLEKLILDLSISIDNHEYDQFCKLAPLLTEVNINTLSINQSDVTDTLAIIKSIEALILKVEKNKSVISEQIGLLKKFDLAKKAYQQRI